MKYHVQVSFFLESPDMSFQSFIMYYLSYM